MAYVYREVRSSDEVHDDEIVCVIYLDPHHNGNFTAVATDERLIEAFKDCEAGKCRFVVWRDEDNPNYYQAYNEYGAIVDKGTEPKNNPWESEAFIDFLNDVNQLATDKYGWNVAGHKFDDDEEWLELFFIPVIGSDALSKKF